MRTRQILVGCSLTPVLGGMFLLGGCEDPASRAQANTAAQIEQAGLDYSRALPQDDRSTALGSVVSTLSQAGDSTAAALLEASMLRDVADVHLGRVLAAESDARAMRAVLQGLAFSVHQLHAASEQAGADVSSARPAVQAARAAAEQALSAARADVARLEGPVNERKTLNGSDAAEVVKLRAQSRSLREEAFSLGNIQGFEKVRSAVDVDRRADAIEKRIAAREIELIDLEFQLTLAKERVEQATNQLNTAAAAESEIAELSRARSQSATELRGKSASVKADFDRSLKQLQDLLKGDLADAYARCESTLERAAAKAQAASSSDPAAATMLRARIAQMTGQMHATRALGLENHALLLASLVEAGDALGGAAGYRSELEATGKARDAALEASRKAYADAAAAVAGIAGNSQEATILKTRLEAASRGEAADLSAFAPRTNFGGTGAPTTGGGFATPEELLAYIGELTRASIEDQVAASSRIYHATSAADRTTLNTMRDANAAMLELDRALRSKTGQGLMDASAVRNMPGASFGMPNARITSKTDDKATITYDSPMGGSASANLVKVGNAWFVDIGSMIMGLAPGNPQAGQAMTMMLGAMGRAARSVAQRVNSGAITSADQAVEELGRALMGGMGGAGGAPN